MEDISSSMSAYLPTTYFADVRQGIATEEEEEKPKGTKDGEAQRRGRILMGLFCFVWLLVGVGFGCAFEGWSLLTALYVAVQIVTTIGYGDITVHTDGMKLFMAIYVLVCIIFIANAITDVAEGMIRRRSEQMRYQLAKAEAKLRRGVKDVSMAEALHGPRNQAIVAFFLLLAFVLTGTVVYAVLESCSCSYGVTHVKGCVEGPRCAATGGAVKSWIDSFYMAVITLTTVGFGDHSPKSWSGRIFGCGWMLLGVVATGNFVSALNEWFMHRKKKARTVHRISRRLFKILDTDHSGALTKDEFRTYALLKYDLVSEDDLVQISQLFELMDKDRNGFLTYAEIESGCGDGGGKARKAGGGAT